MRRIERLYAISDRLRMASPSTVSAERLARELDVTRRTIERDLAALRAAGVPLYGRQGKGGGVGSIARNDRASRSVVSFTDAEIIALIVASHLAVDAPYATEARTAIAKLADTLDEPARVGVDALRSRFLLARPDDRRVSPRVMSAVEAGVRDQVVLRLTFSDRNGDRTVRKVEPAGFYAADGAWFLVAWCRLRRGGRMFSLKQISQASVTAERFERRDVSEVLGWVPKPGSVI